MLEIVKVQVLYSSDRPRSTRVVAVLLGGWGIPTRSRCETVLAMDPEVDSPVAVLPFGALEVGATYDRSWATEMIAKMAPEYSGPAFTYRCTRIQELLLVKVLVQRTLYNNSESGPGPESLQASS